MVDHRDHPGGVAVKAGLCAMMVVVLLGGLCGSARADNVTVGAISSGMATWAASGGSRLLPFLFQHGPNGKWLVCGLSPTALAIISATIVGGYMLNNYSAELNPYFDTWLSAAGFRFSTGWQKYQTSTGYIGGLRPVAGSNFNANVQTVLGQTWGGYAVTAARTTIVANGGNPEAMGNTWVSEGYWTCSRRGVTGGTVGPEGQAGQAHYYCAYQASGSSDCGGSSAVGAYCWIEPHNTTSQTETDAAGWLTATAADIEAKFKADITAGLAAAQNAWREQERALEAGLAGTKARDKTMIDTPAATGQPYAGTTPRQALTDQGRTAAVAQNPAAITALENPPTPGDTLPTPDVRPYTDPGYSGAWSPPAWPAVTSLSERMTTFISAAGATGLFALPNQLTSTIPAGSCEISFSAGVFGNQSYSFCDWPATVVNVIKAIVMLGCAWLAIKIVTLKGGDA